MKTTSHKNIVLFNRNTMLRFISNEFRVMQKEELLDLQAMVRELLSYTINQGLPFPDEFHGKGFKEYLCLVRNTEEALLAVHFHIAELTEQVSNLDFEIGYSVWGVVYAIEMKLIEFPS